MAVIDRPYGPPPDGTSSGGPPVGPAPGLFTGGDRPRRPRSFTSSMLMEAGGSALAALALVWIIFSLAGISAPFGMLVSWFGLFFTIYGILCWRLYGILVAKDRMATVGIWEGPSPLCSPWPR